MASSSAVASSFKRPRVNEDGEDLFDRHCKQADAVAAQTQNGSQNGSGSQDGSPKSSPRPGSPRSSGSPRMSGRVAPAPHHFSRTLDYDTAEERDYRRRTNDLKTVLHWGQRKLLISEVEFLTQYVEPEQETTLVYAGAAPGTHILFLAEMFPTLHFILVDPRPFSIKDVLRKRIEQDRDGLPLPGEDGIATPPDRRSEEKKRESRISGGDEPVPITASRWRNVDLRNGFFTDEMAVELRKSLRERGHVVLFCSDVRTSEDAESQDTITHDMNLQQGWHLALRPRASLFKFRLPWTQGETEYLRGRVTLPVWSPVTSTECRLIVDADDEKILRSSSRSGSPRVSSRLSTPPRSPRPSSVSGAGGSVGHGPVSPKVVSAKVSDNKHLLRPYNHGKYERQMFYFQTEQRTFRYQNPYIDYYQCRCYDCTAEAAILEAYVTKFREGKGLFPQKSAAQGSSSGAGRESSPKRDSAAGTTVSVFDKVAQVSELLDRECHRDRTVEGGRTIFMEAPDPVVRKKNIKKRQRLERK